MSLAAESSPRAPWLSVSRRESGWPAGMPFEFIQVNYVGRVSAGNEAIAFMPDGKRTDLISDNPAALLNALASEGWDPAAATSDPAPDFRVTHFFMRREWRR
jgi:hypothetical protein